MTRPTRTAELAARWLDPRRHRTDYDAADVYAARQYAHGVAIATQYRTVEIDGESGHWIARHRYEAGGEHSALVSHERIGYHRSTADLMRGFLDGDAAIVVVTAGGPVTVRPSWRSRPTPSQYTADVADAMTERTGRQYRPISHGIEITEPPPSRPDWR